MTKAMKIDLFLKSRKGYTFENFAAKRMQKAFLSLGIDSALVFEEDCHFSSSLSQIAENPPSLFLSFSSFVTHLGQLTDVPHLIWETKSLALSLGHLKEKRGYVGFGDRNYPFLLASWLPNRLLPLLHAYDPLLTQDPKEERPFDCVLLEALVDLGYLEKMWEENYSLEVVQLFRRLAETPSQFPLHSLLSLFVKEKKTLAQLSLGDLAIGIEEYIKAKRVLNLIAPFSDIRLDLFGTHIGNNWLTRLENKDFVYLHSPLPFTEHIELLKKTKILLIDQLVSPDGTSEWLFQALSLGVFPLTTRSIFLEELFGKKASLFYDEPKEAKEKASFFLAHPEKRREEIEALKSKITPHTYEKRAEEIATLFI